MSDSNNPIHANVQERYGRIAREFDGSTAACCDPADSTGCCSNPVLYDVSLIADLPESVTGLSLGCGDPVTIAALAPGERVLDLGSGAGIDVFLASRQVGAAGHVAGVDMTPDMLRQAEANRATLGYDHVAFHEGHIEDLPLADSQFDVVMSNCVINLSPDKAAVFREAFRVLKPGGRLAVSDVLTEGQFSAELLAEADLWASCISGAIDVADYTGLMRAAGFTQIEVEEKGDPAYSKLDIPGVRVFSARVTAVKPA